jgi:hypothetical protein
MLTRSFDPGFRIELHHKDLGILTAAAREAGVITPISAVVAQLMASAWRDDASTPWGPCNATTPATNPDYLEPLDNLIETHK